MKENEIKARLQQIDVEKREIQKQLAEAEREDRVEQLTPFIPAAIRAHDLFCCYNHTDGCSWESEVKGHDREHDWGFDADSSSHRRWLEDVFKTANETGMTSAQITEILDGVARVKLLDPRAMEVLRHLLGFRR